MAIVFWITVILPSGMPTNPSLPRPPFVKSDHSSVLPLPDYRQKLKREAPTLRMFQRWSDQSDSILQDYFEHVDWKMFRAASDDDIKVYSDTSHFSSGRVLKMWCRQKLFASTPTKNSGLIAMFEQPCQRQPLPLNPETWKNKNKPTTTFGKPLKPPNNNTNIQ